MLPSPLNDHFNAFLHGELNGTGTNIQHDQINMAVMFWYLVKSSASVRYSTVTYTDQVTFHKVP